MGQTDRTPDGVEAYPADARDLNSYRQAEAELSKLQAPILLRAGNHERLFIAAMDGTGNSMFKDNPENWSVAARIAKQIDDLKNTGVTNIASGYVEGTFTQDNPVTRVRDGITGHTFERRVETAYYQFCKQAKEWLEQDPQAQIRIAGIGFSRGAEEVAALHRMVEERGILDPDAAKVSRDKDGLIKKIEYTKPPLVEPGKTLQAAMLLDPVSTGVKEHDRRLPSSVVSAFQISAEDERRDQFKSTNLLQPGFTEGHRFLNVTVAGVHSNIGDCYALNGLGVRNFNLAADFLNSLSDRPYVQKRAVPDDPALNVIHRSDQHLWIYTQRGYRDGMRDRHDDVAPSVLCQAGTERDCRHKEPIDPVLDAQLERRAVAIGPVQAARESHKAALPEVDAPAAQAAFAPEQRLRFFPRTATDDYLDAYCRAVQRGDGAACSALTRQYEQSPQAQIQLQAGRDAYQAGHQRTQEEEQRQAQVQQWQMQQQDQDRAHGRGRSM